MPRLRRAGPRTAAQRWAAAALAATTIGLIAVIATVVFVAQDRAVPVPVVLMSVLLPAGLGTLLALILAEARRQRR